MLFGLVSGADHICADSPEGGLPCPAHEGAGHNKLGGRRSCACLASSWFVLGSFLWFRGVGCVG